MTRLPCERVTSAVTVTVRAHSERSYPFQDTISTLATWILSAWNLHSGRVKLDFNRDRSTAEKDIRNLKKIIIKNKANKSTAVVVAVWIYQEQ
jgi:hypothetical protein